MMRSGLEDEQWCWGIATPLLFSFSRFGIIALLHDSVLALADGQMDSRYSLEIFGMQRDSCLK